ncbi:hypothetical protein [Fluviicola sp.]|uniref:hypothetical protein n=1 Tax=Fluviicola sp. TaxID=1917219 RepID=UPI003D26CA35
MSILEPFLGLHRVVIALVKEKRAFILVKENSPSIIEGCMIFSIHETFGPFMDYLEVAPSNWGSNGKYKGVAGCLIAYACRLSFIEGTDNNRGVLTFKAFAENEDSQEYLERLYRTKYMAVKNPFGYMEIYSDKSKILIDEYLYEKEE